MKIGGISGIIGRADKINRIGEKEYLDTLNRMLKKELDFIMLHETPNHPKLGFLGNEKIRETIEHGGISTIFCGHCFWEKTLVKLSNDSQIINVDSKVVILKKVK
ncbi:metallophosphoesterase family protein [Flammeovirga sp. EKP202]|uniref:metallophosphoesterase family protein n=1 Tax=Flammeovirga sp. EKP202 TaxID=2770592 RepID=UPI00165F3001|nr:metallophosphoesterase family protein [Flammeovirga sp. EKP202]MBD0404936.1 metallophosphoesterase [Flammeovirga sp. EKP202]